MLFAPTSPWTCQINIRRVEDTSGTPLSRPYEAEFGGPIHSLQMVEPMLRRAQLAAVNPDRDLDELIHFDLANYDSQGKDGILPPVYPDQQSFSRNVVAIELQGPDMLNLTFIDLPGKLESSTIKMSISKDSGRHDSICPRGRRP